MPPLPLGHVKVPEPSVQSIRQQAIRGVGEEASVLISLPLRISSLSTRPSGSRALCCSLPHLAHRDVPQGRKSHWSLTLPSGDNWKFILEFCCEAGLSPIDLPPAGEFLSFSLGAKLLCLMCFFQTSMLFSSNSLLLNELKLLKI